jgi:isoamylase
MSRNILHGHSYPLGATVQGEGVNFSLFSKDCEFLELLLFDSETASEPSRVFQFNPKTNHTSFYWHMYVPGLKAGQIYAYRAYGPFHAKNGQRFDGTKILLDPYGKAVVGTTIYDRMAAIRPGDNCAKALKNLVVDTSTYDWEDDEFPNLPYSSSVIYELHVGGFTKHPNSGVTSYKRGTYAGLVEKIPYLKDLGITAVELMPVQQFDEQDAPYDLPNYWGYSPIAFFAPHAQYSSRKGPLGPLDEFRDMVKAFHKEGIEIILDVVFNHTAEGNHGGPTLSLKGLANSSYYMLEEDSSKYANYSGCGNTLNSNNSIVRRLIADCLRYWVAEMHVDGFRFDLASVLARGEKGQVLENPPILWSIESDPILAGTKLIAEAWDAAGLYQVGSFVGHRFTEWNGRYRDEVRAFIKSDKGVVRKAAERVSASLDLYMDSERDPNRSINFITCHDGFTLNDLVSYNEKHNEANKEGNRDGATGNYSWNCGKEGPSVGQDVEKLRLKQIKNYLLMLFVSQGTPMICMGDEARRTQQGNNNAYCQDNELSWFDWDLIKKNEGLFRFVKGLIQFTQNKYIFREERFWIAPGHGKKPHIFWHGVRQGNPDWGEDSHSLSFTLLHEKTVDIIHVILNSYWKPLKFELPPVPYNNKWKRIFDTSIGPPDDYCIEGTSQAIQNNSYVVGPRSSVILLSKQQQ